jgi:hypothetical protein
MKDKKRRVYRVGSQIYYGDILLATLHEDIDLRAANPKDLKRFEGCWTGRRNHPPSVGNNTLTEHSLSHRFTEYAERINYPTVLKPASRLAQEPLHQL